MTFEEFKILAQKHNVIPVYKRITADLLTPVLAYIKLRSFSETSFLLESVEGIGRLARYSFIGRNPRQIISNKGNELTITSADKIELRRENILDYLQSLIKKYNCAKIDDLPDFSGGIVGYFGYENIALIEDVLNFTGEKDFDSPDSVFGIYKNIVAFDHYKHQIILISNVFVEDDSNIEKLYKEANQEIEILHEQLLKTVEYSESFKIENESNSEEGKSEFENLVTKAKENIYNGDVFQIVLSKRFNAEYVGDLLNVYRALRIINPSPYMYYMEFPDSKVVIGTSPEDLLKVKNRTAEILPIAGTRKRGKTTEEDLELERDLLFDPKEIAEHTMLVDLARNDLGRVCDYGSIKITEKMNVNRFSHVMHIVSRVVGELQKDKDCIDALKASFPAGTVTGAPKIRAMQLINEYENLIRNVYAGAVGYIDFSGNLDMCIAIRTLFSKGSKIYWQAGAGIVADSIPENEFYEIQNKSAALKKALKFAEDLDEDISNR
ncbi:anthranilate synthase, aminase component [hydrocarbon metagenome]|uniref:Anthranilate synthase component 1 n=1 Tax=hydrocarbon metagenome TaxID=938273 RepID=A0A0W8FWP3_9ZZZZ